MFRWLTNLLIGAKKKDTEIRKLKEEIPKGIEVLKEKAKRGDSEASLKLIALEETITEQSVRLCGKRSKAIGLILISVLALGVVGGCNGKNRVEEEDRQGIDMALQIDVLQDAELDRLEDAMAEAPTLKEKYGRIVQNMRIENDDRKQIHKQLLSNFGPPQAPVIYDHAGILTFLEKMKKAHSITFWAMLGTAILGAGATALGIARSPLAKLIPGFGNVFGAVDAVITGVETYMQKKKDAGESVHAEDLAGILQSAVGADPHIAKLVEARLDRVKAKLGIEPAEEKPPPPPVPAVAPPA